MRKLSFRTIIILGALFLMAPAVVLGQSTAELCRAFINNAFRDIGNNCANLGTEEACYGFGNFGEVTSTFYANGTPLLVREDVFDEPSARVSLFDEEELETVESIETQEFFLDRNKDDNNDGRQDESENDDRWGVVFQEVRANLPRQLEQDSAIYVLFGGARIENDVFPEDALTLPETTLEVQTNANTFLFGSPEGLGYTVPSAQVGIISGTLEADGVSPDGEWVRVFFKYDRKFGERATAWVKVSDLVSSDGVADLPVIGPDTHTPMQSLFLSNIFNDPICSEVPLPGLLVQGPDKIETDFFIDNVPMRVTSAAFIEQISERRLRVTALNGFTVLFPDTGGEEVIPAGFTRVLCLTEEQDLGIDGQENDRELDTNCSEPGPSQLTPGQLGGFASFSGLPGNLFNYNVVIPTEICASGIGGPTCVIQLPGAAEIQIQSLCQAGTLPSDVCQAFGF